VSLFLIGFMAAGKTTVGRALAARTGRRFVDLDDAVAAMGEPVAQLVARDEPEFRRREAAALAAVSGDDVVVATGGGAAAYGDNLDRMRSAGVVVALGVDVSEAQARAAEGPPRPLLANAAQLARDRAPIYRRAHAVIETGGKSIEDVVDEVAHVERVARSYPHATILALGERSYPITVGDRLDAIALPQASKTIVITDHNVAAHWRLPGLDVIELPPGEQSKSFATYERLCTDLIGRGLDRGSLIVALGGGVVGDLAGFVAATLFRGIRFVQIPTTIVAMTDAAIGGKTAIDVAGGKNLVGAFHQPQLVACALETLATLPERERRAGFGELWKYALLDGAPLWRAVAACASWARTGGTPPAELRDVIDRSIAYKAAIVGRDELERTGFRALLNLGHTVGHAIESASGMLHGEAVALGLVAACRVSTALVGTRASLEQEVIEVLHASGLAADIQPWLSDDVLARLTHDKKRVGKALKFIAIHDVGLCEPIEIDVTELRRILRPNPTP